VAKSNDSGVEDGGEGRPGMTFNFDKIQEFARALRAREDRSSCEPGKGWGAKGSGLTMGDYSSTASAGANDDATMDKGDDNIDGGDGPHGKRPFGYFLRTF
jgi:hypothetical protein